MIKNIRSVALALIYLSSMTIVFAQSRLHDIDIRVVLSKNGDARITETRKMTIDDKGSECYIGLGNISPSTIKNFSVSDETNRQYKDIGTWDKDLDRPKKTGLCGIVEKGNGGYELCWGLGESGERVYTVEYTLTNFLRGYKDQDGFRHEFVTHHITPTPENAKVTIQRASGSFDESNTKIWAFRYDGTFIFDGGELVAMTSDEMDEEESMRLLVAVDKGIFHPKTTVNDTTMEEIVEEAKEGSDYFEGLSFWDWVSIILLVVVPII